MLHEQSIVRRRGLAGAEPHEKKSAETGEPGRRGQREVHGGKRDQKATNEFGNGDHLELMAGD
jgi:hypothetical protein